MPAAIRHRGLVAFAGAKLEVQPGAELPSRIVVAPWGVHDTPKGRIVIGDRTAAQMPGNQHLANFDRVALDFNHNTVKGSESYQGEPAAVAGHGTPRIVSGEGIVLDQMEWTPDGQKYVGERHYIDLSPTLQLDANGEAVFLHSAAVCRQGAIPGLTLFSAEALPPQLKNKEPSTKNSSNMDPKKLLAALLGVDEGADDAAFETAAKTFASTCKTLNATVPNLTALNADDLTALRTFSTKGEIFKTLLDLTPEIVKVVREVAELKGHQESADRNAIVRDATLQGKAIPAGVLDGDAKLSNTQLRALCAELPVTVPLDRRTFSAAGGATTVTGTSTEELTVLSALGLTPERVKKANA